MHTIFSYIFTSISNGMRCKKTLAHWFFNQSYGIYGGVPTTLKDIKIDPGLVNLFVEYLFVHKTQLTHKTNFKRILAATIMIFHEEFLGMIRNEPSGKYRDTTHHPLFFQKQKF